MNLEKLTRQDKETMFVSRAMELKLKHLEDYEDPNDSKNDFMREAKSLSDEELERRIKDDIGQIRFEKGHNIFVWLVVIAVILITAWFFK